MREISLEQSVGQLPRNTFLVYGSSRVGKTTWAASFPRPLFLSDVTEGGWDSITNMSDDQFFEPGVKPLVWGIEQMNDMATARDKAAPLIASGRVQTLVIDSLSYYSDLFLNYLLGMQAKKDTRAAYGDLGNHLRDLRVKTHILPVNVVWLCLAFDPEDGKNGRPMIPGQQGDKFMAGCHYIFYARKYQEKRGAELMPAMYEMRTQLFQGYVAGNRLGGKAGQLPDPLVGGYAAFAQTLGYDPDELRKRLPPLHAAAPAKPAVAQAKPPIVQAVKPTQNGAPAIKITKVTPTNVGPSK